MTIHGEFFDDVFHGGTITTERIEAAATRLMQLVQSNKKEEAKAAARLLKDIIFYGIADGLCADPIGCTSHYRTVVNAAFGEPTLLDQVKASTQPPRRPYN